NDPSPPVVGSTRKSTTRSRRATRCPTGPARVDGRARRTGRTDTSSIADPWRTQRNGGTQTSRSPAHWLRSRDRVDLVPARRPFLLLERRDPSAEVDGVVADALVEARDQGDMRGDVGRHVRLGDLGSEPVVQDIELLVFLRQLELPRGVVAVGNGHEL